MLPEAQQRTTPPVLQQGPRRPALHTPPAAQLPMLLQWKVTGQAGTAGAAAKVTASPAFRAAAWICAGARPARSGSWQPPAATRGSATGAGAVPAAWAQVTVLVSNRTATRTRA